MSTTYTPPSISAAGLTIPTYQQILAYLLAQYQIVYGASVYLGVDSADYQWISILALILFDSMTALQLAYNSRGPLTAIGLALDGLVKLNGIARLAASYSTATVTLTGTSGQSTVINNGVLQDTNGNLWALPASVTIPSGGTLSVTVTCTSPGAVNANPGEISIIQTPTAGWLSATNPSSAVAGNAVELDSQLRARQSLSVALPSRTLLAGTVAAIAATAGVTRYNVLENPTGSTDGYGNPAHSITAVVEGGASAAIAQAIYNNKGIGAFTNGTTSVTVTDPYTGITQTVSFDRPAYVEIYVSMSIHELAGYTSSTTAAIQNAIVAYLNSLQIGESVIYSEIYGAALTQRPNPDQPLFSIRAVTMGTSASPTGTSDISLTFNQVAQSIASYVVITLV